MEQELAFLHVETAVLVTDTSVVVLYSQKNNLILQNGYSGVEININQNKYT